MENKVYWMMSLYILALCILGVVSDSIRHPPSLFVTSIHEMWGIQLCLQGADEASVAVLPLRTRRAYEILKRHKGFDPQTEIGIGEIDIVDPWGNPYHCKWRQKSKKQKCYSVWSSGPDGMDDCGRGDDVVFPYSRDDWISKEYNHIQILVK